MVESLEAALWAFHESRDYRHGALLAANLGRDADTTAAIYGQLAGAYYGVEGIPAEWRGKLAKLPRDHVAGRRALRTQPRDKRRVTGLDPRRRHAGA